MYVCMYVYVRISVPMCVYMYVCMYECMYYTHACIICTYEYAYLYVLGTKILFNSLYKCVIL